MELAVGYRLDWDSFTSPQNSSALGRATPSLFDCLPLSIVVRDRVGHICFANPCAHTYFAGASDQRALHTLFTPSCVSRIQAADHKVIQSQQSLGPLVNERVSTD